MSLSLGGGMGGLGGGMAPVIIPGANAGGAGAQFQPGPGVAMPAGPQQVDRQTGWALRLAVAGSSARLRPDFACPGNHHCPAAALPAG